MHTNFVIQSNIINRYANQVSTVLIDRKGRSMNITEFSTKYLYLIDSLRNSEENRRIFKEKSHLDGGSFYVKTPQTRMKWELLTILTINSLY